MAIVYFNGDLLNEDEVKVSVNDAGYYYGDGIYEVILYYKGKFIDKDAHLDRLVRCMHNVHFNNVPSNVVTNSSSVRSIIEKGADSVFDVHYEYDKSKYTKMPCFRRILEETKKL